MKMKTEIFILITMLLNIGNLNAQGIWSEKIFDVKACPTYTNKTVAQSEILRRAFSNTKSEACFVEGDFYTTNFVKHKKICEGQPAQSNSMVEWHQVRTDKVLKCLNSLSESKTTVQDAYRFSLSLKTLEERMLSALQNDDIDYLKQLLAVGIRKTWRPNKSEGSMLFNAIVSLSIQNTKLLVTVGGYNIDEKPLGRDSPLTEISGYLASSAKHEMMKYILDNGADPDFREESSGNSPLENALASNDQVAIEILYAAGATGPHCSIGENYNFFQVAMRYRMPGYWYKAC